MCEEEKQEDLWVPHESLCRSLTHSDVKPSEICVAGPDSHGIA